MPRKKWQAPLQEGGPWPSCWAVINLVKGGLRVCLVTAVSRQSVELRCEDGLCDIPFGDILATNYS